MGAADGTVEAERLAEGVGFAFGLPWHPEWACADNPDSMRLFQAFGVAARAYAGQIRKAA